MSKKNITVLGIHLWHDSGASIVRNGKVCTAINENKIINVKHASGYISRILLKYEIIGSFENTHNFKFNLNDHTN